MSKLHQELEEQRARCDELGHIVSTRNSEVQHLKQANQQAQQDIEHLRGTVSGWSLRRVPVARKSMEYRIRANHRPAASEWED